MDKQKNGGCLFLLFLVFGLFLWVFISPMGILGALVGSAVVLYVIRILCLRQKQWEMRFDNGFLSYRGNFDGVSDEDLVTTMIADELKKQFGDGLAVSKGSLTRRIVYTLLYLVLNFTLIHFCYQTGYIFYLCTGLTIGYVLLFLRAGSLQILLKNTKKNPNIPIEEIVRRNVSAGSTAKVLAWLGAIIMVGGLIGFFIQNAESRWTFRQEEDGYCLTDLRPGIFEEEIEIPETYKGKPVVAIAAGAFEENNILKEIVIPDSVVRIGGRAFQKCKNLKEITIPEGVTEIRGNTFDGCKNLEKVTLHDGIVDIHAFAFRDCKALKEIDLPESITEIHESTFQGCSKLKSVEIPDGVTRIAAHAFQKCANLKKVALPDTLMEIGSSAFRDCDDLENIEIPEHTQINERAFKDSPTKIYWRED